MIWIKFVFILEILVKTQATTDVVGNVIQSFQNVKSQKTGFIQNLLPFGKNGGSKPSYKPPGRGKPSYKPPSGGGSGGKPSYRPPGGGGARGKPSYKPPGGGGGGTRGKPSYRPPAGGGGSNGNRGRPRPSYRQPPLNQGQGGGGGRRPSYQNNLQPPPPAQAPASSSSAQGSQSYQSGGGQQQSITDQEMKQLLVNIHDMMKQIVASQQTNTVLASALPASDSYGNPLTTPVSSTSSSPSSSSSNRAPDSYGVAQAAPISGASPSASSSRPASNSNAPDSYGVAKAAPISGSSSSSSAPSSYSAAVASSSGVSSDEPVILSTYQQINSALRRYRDTLQHNKQEEVAELKPVRFPKKPSFNDILMMLEERNREKRREKFIQSRSIHVESDELPELELDSFFF